MILALTLLACDSAPVTTNLPDDTGTPDTTDLTADEAADLLFLREEEKLAHDLYVAFYAAWGTQPFTNVSQSEQTHMDNVLLVLETYNLEDPVGDNAEGVFTDATIQGLYDQLLADGLVSEIAALDAAAYVEEIDLVDLTTLLASTSNADIVALGETLSCGSRNHLRGFTSQLSSRGVEYTPEVLDADTYAEIVGSDHEGCAE